MTKSDIKNKKVVIKIILQDRPDMHYDDDNFTIETDINEFIEQIQRAENLAIVMKLLKDYEEKEGFRYCLDLENLKPDITKDFREEFKKLLDDPAKFINVFEGKGYKI